MLLLILIASQEGYVDIVEMLLNFNANINLKNGAFCTPLMIGILILILIYRIYSNLRTFSYW